VDQVKEFVKGNRRITICEDADMLEIFLGWVQSILKDNLNMCQIATKFVPRLLMSRRIVSTHATTFMEAWKKTQNLTWRES
jgi:hypothetical protein